MKAVVLRPFTFSLDGLHQISAGRGDVVDIPDGIFPGLRNERFIEAQEDNRRDTFQNQETKVPEGRPHIRHLGHGKYAVFRGPMRVTQEPLDKHDAESALAEISDATK